jgi:DNA-binding GntR family transcriptional regulator
MSRTLVAGVPTWLERRADGDSDPQLGGVDMAVKTTKAHSIFLVLADDIAHGRLAPGASLDEIQVAERFAVSRTPVREALRQLERCGLAEARPHRGAVVRTISERQLDEMFAVMAELEALCARWAATAMTVAERRALRASHVEAAALVGQGDRDGYIAANECFHAAVSVGAHNEYLHDLTQGARQRTAPFRRAQFDDLVRLTKSHTEHEKVVVAIERGDGLMAYEHMRSHLGVVRSAVDNVLLGPIDRLQARQPQI